MKTYKVYALVVIEEVREFHVGAYSPNEARDIVLKDRAAGLRTVYESNRYVKEVTSCQEIK